MFGQTNLKPSRGSWKLDNYFNVTANMTSATWNTVASHEIATVTGAVHLIILIEVVSTLTDAADGASIQFGVEGSTNALIGSTGAAGAGGNTLNAGEWWIDTTPTELVMTRGNLNTNLDFSVNAGRDVGYEITGAALTGGTLRFHVFWEDLDGSGSVTAGTGGAL